MDTKKSVETLNEVEAQTELDRLTQRLTQANVAYHQNDAPEISDSEYDADKRRMTEIEKAFPHLKRSDTPTEKVGAPAAEGFQKVSHSVPMLSLGNVTAHGSEDRRMAYHDPCPAAP